ncbi:uncharacterized protein LOC119174042 [Rhipicephalus microplus]|uniref:uncharacterized protein LOC119174042 n=1 Tax=Rhipicephalus microplus TaxID=6941 RepID=UPI003F6A68F8
MRMPPRTFDTLLELLRPAISKQDTNHRPTISAHDCLAMTIRYAKEVRDKLAHYFITDGQVPWQDKVVNSTSGVQGEGVDTSLLSRIRGTFPFRCMSWPRW